MSTALPTSLSNFSSAIDCLDPSGTNWIIFQYCFTIAVKQKKVWGQFDGSNQKHTAKNDATNTEKIEHKKLLAAWQEQEDMALYLLTQKLPDSIFVKYMHKETVADVWSTLVLEFTKKSMIMKLNLHSEFMALHYKKGANLCIEFD
ncbi:hypothetical protein AMATHDRAFT_152920 [Amanita thiersii Skay4041]|uniref:Uncharacterized protein n=1 Tax=Amanita thiersii Skay4041 TaxID=703135 RepID=A0A2A9NHC1_9AGAR|nr:hypothetical protein AMATHDRAFT_152920 [Amanita thiersii Skay4041]